MSAINYFNTKSSVVTIEHKFCADKNRKYNIPKEFQIDLTNTS